MPSHKLRISSNVIASSSLIFELNFVTPDSFNSQIDCKTSPILMLSLSALIVESFSPFLFLSNTISPIQSISSNTIIFLSKDISSFSLSSLYLFSKKNRSN